MTRVSQWFVMNTRWITVALAVVIGIGVDLDAFALVERLRADKEVRARLEGMSASLLDQTPEALDKLQHVYRDTLKTFAAAQSARLTQQPAEADLTRITSRSDAAQWIQAHAADGQSASELATEYDAALDTSLEAGLQKSLDRATTIRQQLVASGLPGFSAGPGVRWALPRACPVAGNLRLHPVSQPGGAVLVQRAQEPHVVEVRRGSQ